MHVRTERPLVQGAGVSGEEEDKPISTHYSAMYITLLFGQCSSNSAVLAPNKQPRYENCRNCNKQETKTDHVRMVIRRAKDSTIHMRSNNTTKLSHRICQSDANTRSHSTVKRSNTFRPNDWIRGSSTGSCNDQTEVLDYRILDGYEENVADDYCRFN